MAYETRVVGDAFAGLSTAEENAFIDAYNNCRTDAQRAAVIKRFKLGKSEVRSHSQKPATAKAPKASADQDAANFERQREFFKKRYDPYYWD